jgi:hypothetical protein
MAQQLRAQTTLTVGQIARRLQMGSRGCAVQLLWRATPKKVACEHAPPGVLTMTTASHLQFFCFRCGLVRSGALITPAVATRGLAFCRRAAGCFSVLIFALNKYCSAKANFGKLPVRRIWYS